MEFSVTNEDWTIDVLIISSNKIRNTDYLQTTADNENPLCNLGPDFTVKGFPN